MKTWDIVQYIFAGLVFLALCFPDAPGSFGFLYWSTIIFGSYLIIALVLNPVSREVMNKTGAAIWWYNIFKNDKK